MEILAWVWNSWFLITEKLIIVGIAFISFYAESLGRRRKGRCGRGDQRADPGHCHQTPRQLVLFGATSDLGIELADLCLQLRQCRDENLERRDGIGRRIAFRVLDDCNQLRRVGRPLWHDLSELAQMASK